MPQLDILERSVVKYGRVLPWHEIPLGAVVGKSTN